MQSSIWKLAALAGVMGIGFLVVLQAQRGLNQPAAKNAAAIGSTEIDSTEADSAKAGSAELAAAAEATGHAPADGSAAAKPTPRSSATAPPSQEEPQSVPSLHRAAPPIEQAASSNPFAPDAQPEPAVGHLDHELAAAEAPPTSIPRRRGLDFRDESPANHETEGAASAASAAPAADENPFEVAAGPTPPEAVTLVNHEQADEPLQPEPEPFDPAGPQLLAPGPVKPALAAVSTTNEAETRAPTPIRQVASDPDAGFADAAPFSLDEPAMQGDSSDQPFGLDEPRPAARAPADDPLKRTPFDDAPAEQVPAEEPEFVPEPNDENPFAVEPTPARAHNPAPQDNPFDTPAPRAAPAANKDDTNSLPPLEMELVDPVGQPIPAEQPANPAADQPGDVEEPLPEPTPAPSRPERDRPAFDDPPPERIEPAPTDRPAPLRLYEPEPDAVPGPPRAAGPEHTPAAPEPRPAVPEPQADDELQTIPRRTTTPDPRKRPDEPQLLPVPKEELVGDGTLDPAAPRGTQQPQLKIEKLAPPHAVLGQPLIYEIVVKNVGKSAAHEVVVEDRIPKGSELSGTIPQAEMSGKTLIWKLGTMPPGQERKIAVKVVPVTEGQIGSVATVNFVAEIASQTVITAPKLVLELTAPAKAKYGSRVPFTFKVTNTGSGDARNVIIRDILPPELKHAEGNDLEYEMGVVPAGQTRAVTLTLTAAEVGEAVNKAVATADGGVMVEAEAAIEILGSSLKLARVGPKHRYLGRPAVYETTVTNDSAEPVVNARVVETVPDGMEFVEASAGGRYDAARRSVVWQIDRVPPRNNVVLQVKLVPKAAGTKTSVVQLVDATGVSKQVQSQTEIEGIPAVSAEVVAASGPVAVGERVAFRVVLRNRGTAAGQDVQLRVKLPPHLEFASGDGASATPDGSGVTFAPIERLEPRGEATFNLVLRAAAAGDARVNIEFDAEHLDEPLSREERVLIFADDR